MRLTLQMTLYREVVLFIVHRVSFCKFNCKVSSTATYLGNLQHSSSCNNYQVWLAVWFCSNMCELTLYWREFWWTCPRMHKVNRSIACYSNLLCPGWSLIMTISQIRTCNFSNHDFLESISYSVICSMQNLLRNTTWECGHVNNKVHSCDDAQIIRSVCSILQKVPVPIQQLPHTCSNLRTA